MNLGLPEYSAVVLRRATSDTLNKLEMTAEFQAQYQLDERARLQRIKEMRQREEETKQKEEAARAREEKFQESELERARSLEAQIVSRRNEQLAMYGMWQCSWDDTKNHLTMNACGTCQRSKEDVQRVFEVSPADSYIGHPPFWTCPMCEARKLSDCQMPWGVGSCWRHANCTRPEGGSGTVAEKIEYWACDSCGRWNGLGDTVCDICSSSR